MVAIKIYLCLKLYIISSTSNVVDDDFPRV